MIFSLRLAAIALLFALAAAGARAQSPNILPPVTRTYAIVNARIVQAPGRVIPRGTVLVRDGLITGVGATVSVPFDAEVIPGDSLVVYAGFIDGLSNAGIPAPKADTNAPDVSRSDPPDAAAGIQPVRFAHAMIDPEEKSIAVLPFVDMSQAGDQEYFADGIAEEILNVLVRIPALKVAGRTSSFSFKGKTQDLRVIGNNWIML